MSGRRSHLSMVPMVLALVALLAAPALGHHKDGHEGGPKDPKAVEQADDSQETSDDKPGNGPKDKDKPHPNDDGVPGNGKGNAGGKDDAGYTDGAPGNNGTIKIDGEPYDTSKGQESHVGCDFRVLYWGTDEGADLTSTLTFVAHPPTGGPFTFVDTITLQPGEPDVAGPYNLVAGLKAAGIEPHPKQGWHIKLTTNTEYSQGADTKHKVFWIKCDESTVPVVEADDSAAAPAPKAQSDTEVLGSGLERDSATDAPASDDTTVAGEALEASPGVFPFTGGDVGLFIAAGLALVAFGTLLVKLRRTA